ncbi:MAG: sensor histidine kinase [Chlorobi bacterium]|nr:sensor histidine kinase [Chlorobiota bacterium]
MNFFHKLRDYHFEVYHFIILTIIIILSQVLLSYLNMQSTEDLLNKTMRNYKLETAERQSDFITSSIELFLQKFVEYPYSNNDITESIESIDYLIYQQLLQKNVEDFCMVFYAGEKILILDSGKDILNYVVKKEIPKSETLKKRITVEKYFIAASKDIFNNEEIKTFVENGKTFHVFVPFSIKGEVIGAVYQKITPDVEKMKSIISSSFSYTGAWISAIILFSLLLVFIFTNYVINERDIAKSELFEQKEKQLTQLIETRKEASFARRIYHAQHKVAKIIGFAKEDLQKCPNKDNPEISVRLNKYMNFIGRAIYEMKTITPPIHVIRNASFNTDINDLLNFIVNNIFRRVYKEGDQYKFNMRLDKNCPPIHINEYVAWEIFEPIINNAVDHNKTKKIDIIISTKFESSQNRIIVKIADTGIGIKPEFLEYDKSEVQNIFKEHISTKDGAENAGYGCYIANENCKRCGWLISAGNTKDGAAFTIKIPVN